MCRVHILLLCALLLTATAGCSRETVYRNLYEGMRTQSDLQNFPEQSRQDRQSPTYDQYRQQQRERLSDEEENDR